MGDRATPIFESGKISKKIFYQNNGNMGIKSYVFEPAESIFEVYFYVGGSHFVIGPCL